MLLDLTVLANYCYPHLVRILKPSSGNGILGYDLATRGENQGKAGVYVAEIQPHHDLTVRENLDFMPAYIA